MSEVPVSVDSNVASKKIVKKKRQRNRKKASGNELETTIAGQGNTAKAKSKRKRKSKNTKVASSTKSHDLQLPHVKVTIRNIVNIKEVEGSYTTGMVDLLREIVQKRNRMVLDGVDISGYSNSSNNPHTSKNDVSLSGIPIVLDESSIQKILIRAKKQREIEDEKESKGEDGDEHVKEELPDVEGQVVEVNDANAVKETEIQVTSTDTDVCKDCIHARLLYLIPPHKSRRRGIIPGHCYLVLSPPVPKFYQEKMQMKSETPSATVSEITSEISTMKIDDQDDPNPPRNGANECIDMTQTPSEVHDVTQDDTALDTASITPADRSKAFAQARIMVNEAVESLSKVCKSAETTKEKNYAGVQVFISQSQKIWKDETSKGKKSSRLVAKYENTIEKNEDFLKFLEARKTMEEERLNRPKPQPGGGLSNSATFESKGSGIPLDENGQPISAIILHLKEKQAAKALAKAKLQAEKKRSKKITKSGKATTVNSSSSNQASGGNATKKKRRNKKKTKDKTEPQPSKLLKKAS